MIKTIIYKHSKLIYIQLTQMNSLQSRKTIVINGFIMYLDLELL